MAHMRTRQFNHAIIRHNDPMTYSNELLDALDEMRRDGRELVHMSSQVVVDPAGDLRYIAQFVAVLIKDYTDDIDDADDRSK